MHLIKKAVSSLLFLLIFLSTVAQQRIWSAKQANAWYDNQPWLVGCNYIPNTAINQLEMWQAETFDTATIQKELGWAQDIGFNVVRVYLHNLVWQNDPEGFKQRINSFLNIADAKKIKTIFVFFDDCWNKDPHPGIQPEPKKGVHNSGWVQSPGEHMHNDSLSWPVLEKYVTDILTTFKKDKRILLWDLYNEPGNGGYQETSMPLLKNIFKWAWSVRPSQPLSVATWDKKLTAYNSYQLTHSDVITFHNYNDSANLEAEIRMLKSNQRPFLCTEYMARTNNSRFSSHLPVFKKYLVGALNWGFVSGKTNTIYPWNSPEGTTEPTLWFHDVFRPDGTPFDEKEVALIKQLTNRK
ncbi:MAG TPA: glycoside hydrolase family 2 TIM barrel-domain containing protein [Flavitalea sp.]|nr:glycoside hydrolase family 2 TIM barrel-domain containing protein [Flavitalea sp.]